MREVPPNKATLSAGLGPVETVDGTQTMMVHVAVRVEAMDASQLLQKLIETVFQ